TNENRTSISIPPEILLSSVGSGVNEEFLTSPQTNTELDILGESSGAPRPQLMGEVDQFMNTIAQSGNDIAVNSGGYDRDEAMDYQGDGTSWFGENGNKNNLQFCLDFAGSYSSPMEQRSDSSLIDSYNSLS